MAAPLLGSVEVQKDGPSRLWYFGHVVEVKSDTVVVVGFEDDVWPKAEYSVSHIRKPPKLSAAELEKFSPHIGEEVELRVSATENAPAGWGVASIRNIKHGFYFVALASSVEDSSNAIVEKDMLRPRTLSTGLPGGSLKQEVYRLPKELESWVCTDDAMKCFEHIEEQSGLICVQTLKGALRLVGDTKTIQRAKMLLQLHIKHQGKIQSFQETLEKQLSALERKRNRIEGTGYKHSVEFQVDAGSIPRIIGRGGETIRSLQERLEVNIAILPPDSEDGPRTLRIFGNSMESIEQAREEVEYVEEVMPVDPQMKSWIIGRGGRTIQSLKESANLVYARLDLDGEHLRLLGTRQNVQDAKAIFETHLMYYNVFLQMDGEMEQILAELREYGETEARWEWGWNRDEEDEYLKGSDRKGNKGGKGAKNGGKGGKSSSGKKGMERAESPSRPPKGKGSKGGKGAGKSGGVQYREDEDQNNGDGSLHYYEETVPRAAGMGAASRPQKGKGSKGGKGDGKFGGWQYREDEDQGAEENNDEGGTYYCEEIVPASRPLKGKGSTGGKSAGKLGGWQYRQDEDEGMEDNNGEGGSYYYEETVPASRPLTGKGSTGGKGAGKSGGWQCREDEDQGTQENDEGGAYYYEETVPASRPLKGMGRTGGKGAGKYREGEDQSLEGKSDEGGGHYFEDTVPEAAGMGAAGRNGAAGARSGRAGKGAGKSAGWQNREDEDQDMEDDNEEGSTGAAAGARNGRAGKSSTGGKRAGKSGGLQYREDENQCTEENNEEGSA